MAPKAFGDGHRMFESAETPVLVAPSSPAPTTEPSILTASDEDSKSLEPRFAMLVQDVSGALEDRLAFRRCDAVL